MELIGKLKDKVNEAGSKSEAKKAIEEAGMLLTDEELGNVAAGADFWFWDRDKRRPK